MFIYYFFQSNNIFMGLWGRVFDNNNTAGNTTSKATSPINNPAIKLGERLQQAAEAWKTEAEEARTRIMQRFNSDKSAKTGAAAVQPASIVVNASASTATGPIQVVSSETDTPIKSSSIDIESIKEKLQDWVGQDGKLDGHQLAALAVVQGLALASLKKHADNASPAMASISGVQNSRFGGSEPPSLSHLGVLLPNSMLSHFEGEWCMRLQNFGNADGYRSVVLGTVPCSTENATLGQMKWGPRAEFTLDCSVKTIQPTSTAMQKQGGGSDTVILPNLLHSAAAKAASDFTAVLEQRLQRRLECRLAVATGNAGTGTAQTTGSGVVLQHSHELPMFGSKMNSIKIRTCNVPPSTVQSPAALRHSNTSLDLHALKLNGRSLSVGEIEVRQALAGTGSECKVALLRLPARALVDGFVLNGALTLKAEDGVWGVGEMASVDVQLGTVKLLHTGGSGAGPAAGGLPPLIDG